MNHAHWRRNALVIVALALLFWAVALGLVHAMVAVAKALAGDTP